MAGLGCWTGSETEFAGLAFLDPEVCVDVILTVRGDDVSSS
jgi:hypothetical protein